MRPRHNYDWLPTPKEWMSLGIVLLAFTAVVAAVYLVLRNTL